MKIELELPVDDQDTAMRSASQAVQGSLTPASCEQASVRGGGEVEIKSHNASLTSGRYILDTFSCQLTAQCVVSH
jgi:hypothetical protein